MNKIEIFMFGFLDFAIRDGKVSQTIDPEIHSRRGRRSQGPDPPTLPDLT